MGARAPPVPSAGHRPQRHTAEAQVMPAPKPARRTRSPSTQPALLDGVDEGQRDGRRTGVAGAVDHRGHPLRGEAQPGGGRLHDADVGLVGHEQGDVVDGDLGPLERQPGGVDRHPDRPAEHLLAAHGHARAVVGVQQAAPAVPSTPRSQPSREPSPGTASTTTAPAPSPNRKALVRSAQLVARVRVSAPIRSTRSMPRATSPAAVTRP